MIALALACHPSLVIADEPTTALDVVMQAQVLQLLERLREQLGLALILISHDLGVLAETCDRIAVMYAGRIVEIGPVGAVFDDPQHPYTKRLLETLPVIGGDRGLADPIPGGPPDPGEPPAGCRFRPRCPYAAERCRSRTRRCARSRPATPPRATSRPGPSGPSRPSRRRGRRGRPDERRPLMEVRDLAVEFRVERGVARARRRRLARVAARARSSASSASRAAASRRSRGRCSAWSSRPPARCARRRAGRTARRSLDELRRRVQMIFQDPYQTLNPRQRVRTIVAEPLRRAGRRPAASTTSACGARSRTSGSSPSASPSATRTSSRAASASGSRSPPRSCSSPTG